MLITDLYITTVVMSFCGFKDGEPLTFAQVDHAVFPAQSGLDFHSEANLFAN